MTSCVSLYFNFVCWKLLKMIKLISRYVFLNLLDHSIFISPCSKHITKLNFHFAKNLLEYIWDLTHGKEKRLHKCHQFIWTTVFGLLDTRNLYFFMPYPPPTSPCDPMLSECWRKAIRRTTRKLSELVDFLGSLLTTWNTGGTEQAFPRTAHMVVCTSPRIRRKRRLWGWLQIR